MAIETKIYSLLTGTSAVATSIEARVYPMIAPQNPTFPFVIYQRISGGQQNTLSGYSTLENPRIQIDIYSTSYSQVKSVSESIHTTMNGATAFKSVLLNDTDFFEDEFNEDVYRISMDFDCWNRE